MIRRYGVVEKAKPIIVDESLGVIALPELESVLGF
jgi:hypothetical protein